MRGDASISRRKGSLVAVLLFLLGAVAGVAADRLWLALEPATAEAAPLTPDAMSEALALDATEDARVRTVLDSVRVDLAAAAAAGPDSLRTVARRGRQRLEEALPPDRRDRFREWMQEHHARMRGMMGPGMMGPGMMREGPGGGMGPGMMREGPGGRMGPGMMRGADSSTSRRRR